MARSISFLVFADMFATAAQTLAHSGATGLVKDATALPAALGAAGKACHSDYRKP